MGDIRYACRVLVRSPGFTAVTVLLTALGIGATTTMFSLAYGVLLKPLPWPEPHEIVRLQETRGGSPGRVPWTITNTTFHAWRDRPSTIEELGGWTRGQMMAIAIGSGEPERLQVGSVTPGLLRVLRVTPAAGRMFADEDVGGRGGPDVVVLGFRLWQRLFNRSPDVIGRTVRLDDRSLTVVGVMPREFAFPDRETEAWLPLGIPRVDAGAKVISATIFNAIARLRPAATAAQAASEATSRARAAPGLGSAALALFGSDGEIAVAAIPARDALTADVRPALVVLLAAVALLFAAAIASVLVLQSSRAVTRRREIAVRMAIGATPWQVARQWLVESAVLGIGGGIAGILVAAALHALLPAVLPPGFPRIEDVGLDASVVIFGVAITLVAIVVSGVAPALQTRERSLVEPLTGDPAAAAGKAATTRSRKVRLAMMMAQVAIASILLLGTVLLARSFAGLLAADRGFDPRDVLTAHITIKPRPFASQSSGFERVQQRLQALAGVDAVGFGNALPFVTSGGLRGLTIPSLADPASKIPVQAIVRTVSPGYFPALGLRLISGRTLSDADTLTSRPVVVVNRTFAVRYLDSNPIGRILPMSVGSQREWEVVGIVDDLRQGGLRGVAPPAFGGVTDPPQPEMFFTYRQWTSNVSEIAYVIRTRRDAPALAPAFRAILREEEPTLAVDSIMTMEDRVMHSLARPRTYAVLIGAFALFAVAIAAVGLFGVMSYLAAQRTREIGIRMALGAQPRHILRLVTREALAILVGGLAIGLSAAFVLARSLTPLLYRVSAHDIPSFVIVPIVLGIVVAVACAMPARRATRVSPLVALRHQ